MLNITLDEEKGIAIFEPDSELSKSDFQSAYDLIDPYLEKSGKLNGLIIHIKSFPGWDSFAALITHIKFIKDHHKKVSHLAFVTDSTVGSFGENIAQHFISAEIKSFPFNALEEAIIWTQSKNNK